LREGLEPGPTSAEQAAFSPPHPRWLALVGMQSATDPLSIRFDGVQRAARIYAFGACVFDLDPFLCTSCRDPATLLSEFIFCADSSDRPLREGADC